MEKQLIYTDCAQNQEFELYFDELRGTFTLTNSSTYTHDLTIDKTGLYFPVYYLVPVMIRIRVEEFVLEFLENRATSSKNRARLNEGLHSGMDVSNGGDSSLGGDSGGGATFLPTNDLKGCMPNIDVPKPNDGIPNPTQSNCLSGLPKPNGCKPKGLPNQVLDLKGCMPNIDVPNPNQSYVPNGCVPNDLKGLSNHNDDIPNQNQSNCHKPILSLVDCHNEDDYLFDSDIDGCIGFLFGLGIVTWFAIVALCYAYC